MITKPNRDLKLLNPSFKQKVDLFLKEVNKDKETIFVTEATRSKDRQEELYKLWLSQTRESNHQLWLAIDIGFYWEELYPSDFSIWRRVADIARKYWIVWWYDLWKWDKPHFQDNWVPYKAEANTWTQFTEILSNLIKDWYEPIFNSPWANTPLSERAIKELIDIALARFIKKYNIK